MEVIKKGTLSDRWNLEVKCDGEGSGYANGQSKVTPCGSILRVSAVDISGIKMGGGYRDWYGDWVDSPVKGYFKIKCPVCCCLTVIPEKNIPDSIKEFTFTNPGLDAGGKPKLSSISISSGETKSSIKSTLEKEQ